MCCYSVTENFPVSQRCENEASAIGGSLHSLLTSSGMSEGQCETLGQVFLAYVSIAQADLCI